MINGSFYKANSSKQYEAQLDADNDGLISLSGVEFEPQSFASLSISSRVGNTARTISFADGSSFETLNNHAVDQLIEMHQNADSGFDAHRWESKLKLVALSAVVFFVLLAAFVKIGLPMASNSIAHRLPAYVSVSLAENVLQELDESYFEKSKLSEAKKAHIKRLFSELKPADSDISFSIYFRYSDRLGANAIALPDGTIVVTDDLVELSQYDEELISVLLHEIGHVVHRHSLRNVVEAAGIYALYSWMTGDIEVTSSVLITLSAILLKADYSRDHESEADAYSLEQMLERGINPNYFPSIMNKITRSSEITAKENKSPTESDSKERSAPAESDETGSNAGDEATAKDSSYIGTILDYMSSHPPTKQRNEHFAKAAKLNGYDEIKSLEQNSAKTPNAEESNESD